MKKTIIISGFPGVGKTEFYMKAMEMGMDVSDSDSSEFSWISPGMRNPDFPSNYVRHIKFLIGKRDVVLVSSHKEVRDAMRDDGIDYIVVYPDPKAKKEYLARYVNRGSADKFVQLLDENWDRWIGDLEADEKKRSKMIALGPGKYLSDVISYITDGSRKST